jgi:hypothetical protein
MAGLFLSSSVQILRKAWSEFREARRDHAVPAMAATPMLAVRTTIRHVRRQTVAND